VTTTAHPVHCTLADIADHRFVTVDARITAITVKHQDTRYPWATITLTASGDLVDVNVYPTTYALCSEHLQVGNRVTVSAEVAHDADGLFMAAHTIHSDGANA
jgi:hypothetical protein